MEASEVFLASNLVKQVKMKAPTPKTKSTLATPKHLLCDRRSMKTCKDSMIERKIGLDSMQTNTK